MKKRLLVVLVVLVTVVFSGIVMGRGIIPTGSPWPPPGNGGGGGGRAVTVEFTL